MQQGHVRQRRPGGPWTAYWRRANGKQTSKGGFPTEDAARAYLMERILEVERGTAIEPSQLTVTTYLELWLRRKRGKTPGTIRNYRGRLTHQIAPHLGDIKLQQLTTLAIDAWLTTLLESKLSTATVRQTYTVLKAALSDAVEEGLLPRNPAAARSIELPPLADPEIQFWTEAEAARFLERSADHPFATLYRFLLASQLRIGEALALTWARLDLERGDCYVRANYRYTSGQTVGGVKRPASHRRVSLDSTTRAYLRAHRDRLAFAAQRGKSSPLPWQDHDLVFPNDRGGHLVPVTVARHLDRLCREARVTRITPHGLRHTGATLLLRAGVPLHVVSRRLGHRSTDFTARVYAHVLPSQEADAARLLGDFLDQETGT